MAALVEREAELALVRAAVAGGVRAVVVSGPAGVGKSRLVAEAVGDTPAVRAMASPMAPVPFGVAGDLLPELGAGTVRAYVAALRRRPEPVVVVEDLHWADADSLAVLVDLARAPDGPVLLATTREEPHRPLVEALAALASSPDVTMLPLAGLSTGGVAAMLEGLRGGPVPVRTALQIRRRTDGLPYWVEELARSAGPGPGADLAGAALPEVAGVALRSRVEAAGPAAVRLAELAAVLDAPVEPDLLARLLGERAGAVWPPLRRLVDASVLVEVVPGRFGFGHALTREAVARRVPAAARQEWHARAYTCLRAAGAGDAALAWHAAGAGLCAETVEAALRAAATALAAGSGAEALRLAELALETGAAPAGPAHALAARAAYAAGWFDEAEPHARAWRDAAGGGEPAADAECLLASLRWRAGDLAGQWAALDAALGHPDLAGPVLARVRAARANALMRAERWAEAVAEADLALAVAAGTGEQAARRSALVDKGTALCNAALRDGQAAPAEGLALLAEAERECVAAGDRGTLGRALNNALAPRMAGRPAAEQWAVWEATWQRVSRLGLGTSLGKIVRHAVDLAETTGQWQRGWRVVTDRLPEEAEPVERVVLAAKAALLALEAGRIDEAARLAERSTAAAAGMDQFWAVLYVALVEVALAARTAPPAVTVRALGRYRRAVPADQHPQRSGRAWQAGAWALDGGVPPATVRAFLAATLPGGLPDWCAGDAELALAEAAGDDAAAIRAGERLLARELGAVRRADALTRLGRSRLRAGRPREAGEAAAEACTLLAGWPGFRLEAARALRQAVAGVGPALTAREREVRSLVAEGLSNQEIADRLGVSPRTVAVHLSRLLAKTGCASRTELAVQVLRAS
jgi:DNA-binding CsgD family transcriptional regulator